MKTISVLSLSEAQATIRRLAAGLLAAWLLAGCASVSPPAKPALSYAEAVARLQDQLQGQLRGRLTEQAHCRFFRDGLKASERFDAGALLPEPDPTLPNLLFRCKEGANCVAFTYKSNQFTVAMPWIDFGNWPSEEAAKKQAVSRSLSDLIALCGRQQP